jgi:hypothetical protein
MSHIVRGLSEVARHFEKSTRTAQRWRRAGMPKLAGGRYDLGQVEEWLQGAKYLGSTFRQLEADTRVDTLFQTAVVQLRMGLENLCGAYLKSRGRNRALLVDRAVRDILHGTMRQVSLLEKEGGGAPKNDKPGMAGEPVGPGGEGK